MKMKLKQSRCVGVPLLACPAVLDPVWGPIPRKQICIAIFLVMVLFLPAAMLRAQKDDAPRERSADVPREGDRGPRDTEPRPRGPRDGDRVTDPDRPREPSRPPRGDGPFPGGPGGPFPGGPPHPLLMFFDLSRDGELSAEEITGAGDVLKSLDRNKDGKLTREELMPPRGFDGPPPGFGPPVDGPRPATPGDGPRGFGDFARRRPGEAAPADPAVVERIMSRDKNGDGTLDRDELPQPMHRLFDTGDANGDGKLSKAEVEQALQKLPKPQVPPAGASAPTP